MVFRVVLALLFALLVMRIGIAALSSMARPIPEPPPPGELRKVKLIFRCTTCGTEVRMTAANNEDPEAPRHCMDEMDLVVGEEL